VVGLKVISQNTIPGERIIVDGTEGLIILDPNHSTLKKYEDKIRRYREHEKELFGVINLPGVTLDGKALDISINIDLDEELEFVRESKACGIGLYRTEHLFIDKGDFPTEAEQIEEYSQISSAVYPNKVTIRTYDIGGDKLLPSSEKENNPFLGWRGIRLCLDRENIFREQLRALLISSVKKNIQIMLPMISSVDEVRRTKKIVEELKDELRKEGYEFDEKIKLGIMIEVPSAALLADELGKEVDFFSIGSNDLIQYLLAVDRGNELVSSMFQEFHPAVIRSLKKIIEDAHKNNIKVSLCGEMASIPLAALLLLGLGIDELSVLPGVFAEIKQIIRCSKYVEIKNLVGECLTLPTESEIRNKITDYYNNNIRQYITPLNQNNH
jgi:phosphotransferase system enzyme I (PtsI)